MLDKYQKRVMEHHEAVTQILPELMEMAQRLAPDYWVLQYTASLNEPTHLKTFTATVHNGDDNITAQGRTLGGAIAHLIGCLLDGGVYPLTGNGGRYIRLEDRDYYPELERKQRAEIYAEFCETVKEHLVTKET